MMQVLHVLHIRLASHNYIITITHGNEENLSDVFLHSIQWLWCRLQLLCKDVLVYAVIEHNDI